MLRQRPLSDTEGTEYAQAESGHRLPRSEHPLPTTIAMTSTPCRLFTSSIAIATALFAQSSGQSALSAETPRVVLAESHFNSLQIGVGGWGCINFNGTATGESLVWVSNALADGGYASFREDRRDDHTMYFQAPAQFCGNKSAAYGGSLVFHIRQKNVDKLVNGKNLVLDSGGVRLYCDAAIPGTTWETVEFPLVETAGWRVNGSNRLATRAELQRVLSSLDAILIRGEFSNRGIEVSDLDDVVLYGAAAATPPALSIRPVTGGKLELAWPSTSPGFLLEATDSLQPVNSWQRVIDTAELRGNETVVTVDIEPDTAEPMRFFRLVTGN